MTPEVAPLVISAGSGDRFELCDLWAMSPASYRAALHPASVNFQLPNTHEARQIARRSMTARVSATAAPYASMR